LMNAPVLLKLTDEQQPGVYTVSTALSVWRPSKLQIGSRLQVLWRWHRDVLRDVSRLTFGDGRPANACAISHIYRRVAAERPDSDIHVLDSAWPIKQSNGPHDAQTRPFVRRIEVFKRLPVG